MRRRHLTLTARARTDLLEAQAFYAQVRPELADEVFNEVDAVFDAIRERPESFPRVEGQVRRALCRTFPYKVYFELKDTDEVRVLAIYHASRSPRRWRKRGG